jgi:hypothetical protein
MSKITVRPVATPEAFRVMRKICSRSWPPTDTVASTKSSAVDG